MKPRLQLGVLSAAGRPDLTERTCAELDARGGARDVRGLECTLFCSAPPAARELAVPKGWLVNRRAGPRGGGSDFRWMLGELAADADALLFEDDVQPCRRAVEKMIQLEVPKGCGALSYYDAGDTVGGLYSAGCRDDVAIIPASGPGDLGFHGAQALRLPWWLIQRMQDGEFDPPHPGQDVWIGRLLHGVGLKIGVTRMSLVQHVGHDSLCSPGAKLEGVRAPAAIFPGEDFDACGRWPKVIKPGAWTAPPRVTFCEYHGIEHADAVICPRFATGVEPARSRFDP